MSSASTDIGEDDDILQRCVDSPNHARALRARAPSPGASARARRVLVGVLVGALVCACAGAPEPSGSSRPPPPDPPTPDLSLLFASPAELEEELGSTPARCRSGTSPRCLVVLYPLLRDRLRGVAGSERVVALLEAVAARVEGLEAEIAFGLALVEAHGSGGTAGWLAAWLEVNDSVVAMPSCANADSSIHNRALAVSLPSPCPRVATARLTMPSDELRAAVASAEGACALACPDGREALAREDDREDSLIRLCGPQLVGLTSAEDAILFADDPEALLAVRGMTRLLEAAAVLREARGPEGSEEAVHTLLGYLDEALAELAIWSHVPPSLRVGSETLALPPVRGGADGVAEILVVLGPEGLRVGARPWIGVSPSGALVRRGDAVPGPAVGDGEALDAAALGRALESARSRSWRLPPLPPTDEEMPAWLADSETDPSEPEAMEVDLVIDRRTPLDRVAQILSALDAVRIPGDDPARPLRPSLHLRAHTGERPARVRIVPRLQSAPPPLHHLRLTASSVEEIPTPPAPTRNRYANAPWDPERRVTADRDLPLSRLIEALADNAGELIELEIASQP